MNDVRSRTASIPRVAIIGVTGYASCHLEVLRSLQSEGRLSLVSATVINRAEAETTCRELEAAGCELFPDYRDMFAAHAGRIDLCVVPTPPQLHAEMAVAGLESGCRIFLEKPLAPSLEDILRIQEAEARTGRRVFVGFQDLHLPELRAVRGRLAGGEWGAVRSVSVSCFWPRPAAYYERNRWAGRLKADGRAVLDSPVSNAMGHFAMLGLHMAAPAGIDATELNVTSADLRRAYPIESFDTFAIAGRTPEGVDFRFAGSHACATEMAPEIVVLAEGARLVWRQNDRIVIEPSSGRPETVLLPDYATARRQVIVSAIDRLAGLPAYVCPTATAAAHARLYIGLHASWPIRDVQPERLRSRKDEGGRCTFIEGIESELLAWLRAGDPRSETVPEHGTA